MPNGVTHGRVVATILTLAMTLLVGCGYNSHTHGGALCCEHWDSAPTNLRPAPYSDVYVLFGQQPTTLPAIQPGDSHRPNARDKDGSYVLGKYWITQGETVGFRVERPYVYAVVGEYEVQLAEGSYCWHMQRMNDFKGGNLVLADGMSNLALNMFVLFVDAAIESIGNDDNTSSAWGINNHDKKKHHHDDDHKNGKPRHDDECKVDYQSQKDKPKKNWPSSRPSNN